MHVHVHIHIRIRHVHIHTRTNIHISCRVHGSHCIEYVSCKRTSGRAKVHMMGQNATLSRSKCSNRGLWVRFVLLQSGQIVFRVCMHVCICFLWLLVCMCVLRKHIDSIVRERQPIKGTWICHMYFCVDNDMYTSVTTCMCAQVHACETNLGTSRNTHAQAVKAYARSGP